ncbi:MAG: magnesium-translocating P-type ATPase [Burkholderiales bacterium]|nr:magnesium-translocating P-type ATPase [Burkholderiales bacterium]
MLNIYRNHFARFLKSRRLLAWHGGRHLRHVALGTLGAMRQPPGQAAQWLSWASADSPSQLLQRLGSHADGLTPRQAKQLLRTVGPNTVQEDAPLSWWLHLWTCFRNPFNLLLLALAVISYVAHDRTATLLIGSMVALSTLMRFLQEARSYREADKLKKMVSNTAAVLRRPVAPARAQPSQPLAEQQVPTPVELPVRDLVPGDIVRLSVGDMVPSDMRVLEAKDFFVSQAALTGESLPIEKFVEQRDAKVANFLDLDNIVFLGTQVVSGVATAVVVATGSRTCLGTTAQHVATVERAPTAFQAGVNQVSWLLIRFMLVMAPLVLLINGWTKGDWVEALMFTLSVAVGLTPEMLPMIVTSTLAKGAVQMSRKHVIVKRLEAIQNFGAMDVLCTDKTGTLTQDKICLARHTDVFGQESAEVLQYAYLNSYYQTGLKNLLDVAVLEHQHLHHELEVSTAYSKVDEIPFDFQRRRMSVVVAERGQRHLLICKGALEEVVAICDHLRHGEVVEPMTPEVLARTHEVTAALNELGMRVVAVAVKELPPAQQTYGVADETGMTLMGYVAFLDPPKESTAAALKALAARGITVKVLTGDNDRVTEKICRDVGLNVQGVLLGGAIDAMSDAELKQALRSNTVFAKLTPLHKERLVRTLRADGHVVGFMGDGINDAPALHAADIGISVDSAVDIAKEAADIILLKKSLAVLADGVLEGRRVFSNMLKYIRMTTSSNFGNVFSVLIASMWLPFLPMLPLQLLTQNLLYDLSQTAIPFDNVDAELVNKPVAWKAGGIGRFMLCFGPISSIFDVATFALMWFVFGATTPADQSLFQSGWFVVGLLTQTLIVHIIRTPQISLRKSRPALVLVAATGSIMALGIFLPMGPLAHQFRLQALPASYFAWLVLVLGGYVLAATGMKYFYARRFGWQ